MVTPPFFEFSKPFECFRAVKRFSKLCTLFQAVDEILEKLLKKQKMVERKHMERRDPHF